YGVSVEKVRTINVRPDRRTRYTKTGIQHGKTNAVKKAIVQLAEGEMIDLYSNM
ncbi:MAG: 50S ribosomal protein L23, partial [Flaviramulus sp.]|nr:50S ribosomal protein L23 [Flaviramulus sp.]